VRKRSVNSAAKIHFSKPIVSETNRLVEQAPTVFIVDDRAAILSSLESAVKEHFFLVECHTTAAEFIAVQHSDQIGCVLIDPLSTQGRFVLRWLYESKNLLSILLTTGLIEVLAVTPTTDATIPIVLQPFQAYALQIMVTDGLAGSISRHVIHKR
jgi:FixJ family two-component response regulator